MKVLPDSFDPDAREIFQIQTGLEYGIESFHALAPMVQRPEIVRGVYTTSSRRDVINTFHSPVLKRTRIKRIVKRCSRLKLMNLVSRVWLRMLCVLLSLVRWDFLIEGTV